MAPTLVKEIACGSIAAGSTAMVFSPLELVKTRLQVQDDPAWRRQSARGRLYEGGFLATLRQIAGEDGLLLLWRHGFAGFVGRDLLYSGIRIGGYPTARAIVAGGAHKDEVALGSKILAGLLTGAFGSFLANPLDVMRVRMSVQGGRVDAETGLLLTGMQRGQRPRFAGPLHCLWLTLREEGLVAGLWRGASATVTRAALLSSGNLASYDHSKVLIRKQGWMEEGPALQSVCAVISGIVATTVCNPADVVKSRVMSSGGSQSPLRALLHVATHEGPVGLMRGWCPAYARAGPTHFIQLIIVEQLRRLMSMDSL